MPSCQSIYSLILRYDLGSEVLVLNLENLNFFSKLLKLCEDLGTVKLVAAGTGYLLRVTTAKACSCPAQSI
jgi:hypothetical protein